jgi:hypothetical protein
VDSVDFTLKAKDKIAVMGETGIQGRILRKNYNESPLQGP